MIVFFVMNHLKLLFLGVGLLVFCCNQVKKDGESVTSAETPGITVDADKEDLQFGANWLAK